MVGERVSEYTKELASGGAQAVNDTTARVTEGKPLMDTFNGILERSKNRRRKLLGL